MQAKDLMTKNVECISPDLAKAGEEQITGETIKDIAAAPPAQAA